MASKSDTEQATRHLIETIKSLNIPVIKEKDEAQKFLFQNDDEN